MTGLEHLKNDLSAKHFAQALENVKAQHGTMEVLEIPFYNSSQTIHFAFVWEKSPQKHEYWNNICSQLEKGSYDKDRYEKEDSLTLMKYKIGLGIGIFVLVGLIFHNALHGMQSEGIATELIIYTVMGACAGILSYYANKIK